MGSTAVLRARVEERLSRSLHKWAERHEVNVSEAVRIAVRRLLDEERRRQRAERALRQFDAAARTGMFDAPQGDTKAGGFR